LAHEISSKKVFNGRLRHATCAVALFTQPAVIGASQLGLPQPELHMEILAHPQPINLPSIFMFYLNRNGLYAAAHALADFTNSYDPGWQNKQTIGPVSVSAVVRSSSSMAVSWHSILYPSATDEGKILISGTVNLQKDRMCNFCKCLPRLPAANTPHRKLIVL
jgi:hypothetical protein